MITTNLLLETLDDIQQSGHTPDDIQFIGSSITAHACTWEEFQVLANIEYDSGFGAQEIASDLIIVFKDGARMCRQEYDGSESWHYSKPFVEPTERLPILSLKTPPARVGWVDLAEIHEELAGRHCPLDGGVEDA